MRDAILLHVLDDLALAVILVTPELCVVEANAAAVELLAQGDGLLLDGPRLRVASLAQQRELTGLVSRAWRSPSSARVCEHTMNVARSYAPPLHLCVRRLSEPGPGGASLLALYAIDPFQQAALDGEVLSRAYRLTRTEIRVAFELVQGQSVENIAEILCVSVHTVRTHVKNLFAKTGTSRQADLIRLLAGSLGGLRATTSAASQDEDGEDIGSAAF
jgi:DNA-binding CsgD family transcriptional regulator